MSARFAIDDDQRTALVSALSALVGSPNVDSSGLERSPYRSDATTTQWLRGDPDLVVRPGSAEEVAGVLGRCYDAGVPVIPRGGGTGFAGGAVPIGGGVVVSLERLRRVRSFSPGLWRMQVEAGVTTATVQRLARENGLLFPPDPGAAEQSQIGGNAATNAGGPHAFKYGPTGAWVTGVEAAVAPGELMSVGGPYRKDVSGYDLAGLLVGSEGTLGIITAVWLRLIPAPEVIEPSVAFLPDAAAGCAAVVEIVGAGLVPATLDYLDGFTLDVVRAAYPGAVPGAAGFALIVELDGSRAQVTEGRRELAAALEGLALAVDVLAPVDVWRWRDGVSGAVAGRRGGKVSEDVVVPLDRLREAIDGVLAIGARHGLEACSWGHAGDGNLHGSFLVDPERTGELDRARAAGEELLALAIELGGSISGEHGVGWLKRGWLARQWPEPAVALHEQIKRAFDPKGLLNPGKKDPRPGG
jgi:glycolate dehydrogenase FAD-linked subunit